jgi:metallo-beta-lactamase family protein
MATNATTIFQVHPECYSREIHEAFIQHHKNPFGFNDLHFTSSVDESKALNKMEGPLVIISADGMCEAGRIQYHLMNHIEDPDTTILIVGYMAENTLGRRLKKGDKEVRIQGDWYKRRADVQVLNAFSAHADYGEIIGWLKQVDTGRLKRIFLVHGEPQEQKALAGHLADNGYNDVTVIRYGENYSL